MHLEYVTDWHLDAAPAAVWAALTDVESWPRWWRYVRRVDTLEEGDATGLGARHRIAWASRLPYGLTLQVECLGVRRQRLLHGRASGDLEGTGTWTLRAQGTGTAVRYVWQVRPNRRWMRWAAPLMAPVFRWNHDGVMRAGLEGLRRHLAAQKADARRAPRPAAVSG
jgi:uncharacterized protein YndB with AHSA1/START domain